MADVGSRAWLRRFHLGRLVGGSAGERMPWSRVERFDGRHVHLREG